MLQFQAKIYLLGVDEYLTIYFAGFLNHMTEYCEFM